MAKRRKTAKQFITKFPNHHEVVDAKSRSLTGIGRRKLNAICNRIFQKLGEFELMLDIDGDVIPIEVHTVVEDLRLPTTDAIGPHGLRPTWHGVA